MPPADESDRAALRLHEHFACVLALQQAYKSVGHVSEAFDNLLAILQIPFVDPLS
jgi:hypothetical protein